MEDMKDILVKLNNPGTYFVAASTVVCVGAGVMHTWGGDWPAAKNAWWGGAVCFSWIFGQATGIAGMLSKDVPTQPQQPETPKTSTRFSSPDGP